jgi:hypothetical protein
MFRDNIYLIKYHYNSRIFIKLKVVEDTHTDKLYPV